jgi:hypothetical protein
MAAPTASLPDDPGTLKAMLLAERTRAERLEQIIKEIQRHRFGRRAETLPVDQLLLGFEEVEQTTASEEADHEAKSPAERERGPRSAERTVAFCRATCRVSRRWSTFRVRTAPAAVACCTSSARIALSGSTSSRPCSGFWSATQIRPPGL